MNTRINGFNRQSGLSMIELMVSLTIGLFLTAAVLQVFVASKVTYSTQAGIASLQESGRFAMEYLTRDIRQSGYQGCSVNNTLANVIVDGGTELYDFFDFSDALVGLNNVSGTQNYSGSNPMAGSDVITIKYAVPDSSCKIDDYNPTSATLRCEANHTFQKGDILMVSDCSHSAIFQQSNVNNNNNVDVIVHNTGNGVSPGNCTNGLGLPVVCTNPGNTYDFATNGGIVMKFHSYRYFVAENDFGTPSLFRQGLETDSATLGFATDAVELVEGVEDMQILYGVDTGSDNIPDKYVNAAQASGDFDDVTAVRISLLLQSGESAIVKNGQTLTFNGATQTYSDGRLRKVVSTTIALRNRM